MIHATHKNGSVRFSYSLKSATTSITNNLAIPAEYKLGQNYSNLFNPETVITYQVPVYGYVSLKVYDVLGNLVTTMINEYQNAGTYLSKFSNQNCKLSSGVYFYQLCAENYIQTKKALFLK